MLSKLGFFALAALAVSLAGLVGPRLIGPRQYVSQAHAEAGRLILDTASCFNGCMARRARRIFRIHYCNRRCR
jgi:hypothetical protein